ncbi:MAG TPA: glutamate dehydrogenase, partial [Thermoplasmatales archaeon]|nr:glutamate dehydrogenase [Thermoplasmatales archaeon]
ELGGSLGRREATGRGVMLNTVEILKRMGKQIKGSTVAVQGFGNVGSVAAHLLAEMGCKVVAVSDVSCGIYNPDGLDVDRLVRFVYSSEKPELLENYQLEGNDDRISNKELLELDVDVLIPAALENQITTDNADNIKADIIVEGANGPVTKHADEILNERGVIIVPDILANSGGVIVSYFEWVQGIQSFFWDLDEVNRNLEKVMLKSFSEVWELGKREKTSLRDAAFMLALKKIAKAIELRGIFP